ncbi:MAG: sodium-translocating pyrophosphatase [Candidatus Nomurabacteria bacterium]|jgi:K(+)-stimulated pyrophosphate-energized sodium pump|nr:sodium-translocating pyrophosphatase [Candidatus Nomurabacteria bacterium]
MDYSIFIYLAPIAGAISLIAAGLLAWRVLKEKSGDKKMQEIARAIQEGAMAYLKRQYMTIAVVAVVLALVIGFALGWNLAASFAIGAIASGVAGFIGMNVSVRSNVRTAAAARNSLKQALRVAFRGGSVTGLAVVGLSMLGVSLMYIIFRDVNLVVGFGFGASLISLFARVGGGIYTKAADVGADIVGKVEAGIPEDDPRNPATIADNVGDNVGDCAGMGADLFETYAVTLLASMLIGSTISGGTFEAREVVYPLALGSVAIIASIIAIFFVRLGRSKKIMNALYKGVAAAAIFSGVAFLFITNWIFGNMTYFWVALIGIAITVLMFIFTEYYTSTKHRPVKAIAAASETGAGTNVISGLSFGMESTILPVITIIAGILVAFFVAGGFDGNGLYGIAVAAVSMLSMAGMIVALDSYGPITDNAGGIAEMSEQPKKVREITDELDAVGNTTKAVTKGYAIGSAALGALALFADYYEKMIAGNTSGVEIDLAINNPVILVGLLIGGLLPFAFTSVTMRAVSKAAMGVVNEVRRQFKEIPGILKGKAKPDYARCVDIVTSAALKEMILPGAMAIVVPILVGWLLGTAALAGVLIGIIVVGLMLAMTLNNAGGAWDNAKKLIESDGLYGGKGSEAHKAAVVGDTVGDPTKDTSGPGLNALIKVVNMVAILFISIFTVGGVLGL